MAGKFRYCIFGILLLLSLILPASAVIINEPLPNAVIYNTHDIQLNLTLFANESAINTSCKYEILYDNSDINFSTGNQSVICGIDYIQFPPPQPDDTTDFYTLKVYSYNTTGGAVKYSDVSRVSIVREGGNITLFFIVLFFVFIGAFIFLLFKNIELTAMANMTLQYVVGNFVFFFSLIAYTYFYSEFVKFGFTDILLDLIYISAMTHIFLSLIGYLESLFLGYFRDKKQLAGGDN